MLNPFHFTSTLLGGTGARSLPFLLAQAAEKVVQNGAQQEPRVADMFVGGVLLTSIFLSIVTFSKLMSRRAAQSKPILPYEPRRRVPWQGIDLLVILAIYVLVFKATYELLRATMGVLEFSSAPNANTIAEAHSIIQLLRSGGPWVWVVCFLSAVIVAPIAEEFFFRLLFQGWLEKLESKNRKYLPLFLRRLPGLLPLLLCSEIFALIHFRVTDRPGPEPGKLLIATMADLVSKVAAIAAGIWILRVCRRATAADLGFSRQHLKKDLITGSVAAALMIGPVQVIMIFSGLMLLSWNIPVAPDPIPLFVFALALGWLYFRTHRLLPSILLHMALNAVSMSMALAPLLGK